MPDAQVEPSLVSESERFRLALEKTEAIVDEFVIPRLSFYSGPSWWPRLPYRICGILIIFCSASLPFAAAMEYRYKAFVLGSLSLTVALCSGLETFVRWGVRWRARTAAKLEIDRLRANWRLARAKAELSMKPEDRIDHVYQSTDYFVARVKDVVEAESGEFFRGLKMPTNYHDSKGDNAED